MFMSLIHASSLYFPGHNIHLGYMCSASSATFLSSRRLPRGATAMPLRQRGFDAGRTGVGCVAVIPLPTYKGRFFENEVMELPSLRHTVGCAITHNHRKEGSHVLPGRFRPMADNNHAA